MTRHRWRMYLMSVLWYVLWPGIILGVALLCHGIGPIIGYIVGSGLALAMHYRTIKKISETE